MHGLALASQVALACTPSQVLNVSQLGLVSDQTPLLHLACGRQAVRTSVP